MLKISLTKKILRLFQLYLFIIIELVNEILRSNETIPLLFYYLLMSSVQLSATALRSGIFLHHSTGANIWGPNGSNTSIPAELEAYNNTNGYSGDKTCSMAEQGWPVNPWNNEWERWHRIFDYNDPEAEITDFLSSYGTIVIKSCYPSSALEEWANLQIP